MTWRRFWLFLVFAIAGFLFTFKFLQVPPGIETDEGVIAHNAALIAKTGRDQNGRFMPVFILSGDKMDWKQPVMIYLAAGFFKMFGVSLLVFKLVNVVVALIAMAVMWLILTRLFEYKYVVAGLVIFMTTPIVVIAARIGTETIYPILFSGLWLLALFLRKPILAGVTLGMSFYCYKSMRLIIPPWAILSILYLLKKNVKHVILFMIALSPFLAITPLLEQKYAGAIFDRNQLGLESYRHYVYYWLANLNPAFLFVRSGAGKIFVVEKYGTLLLGALPFFLLGAKKAVEKQGFLILVLLAFLTTPMLFGMAGSEGYGHRLTAMVPPFVILATLGWQSLKSKLRFVLIGFLVFNSLDFLSYYFFKYPTLHITKEAFANDMNRPFYELSKFKNLTTYIEADLYLGHGEGNKFFETAYFSKPLKIWIPGSKLPENSALLTKIEQVEGLNNTGINVKPLFILY